MQVACGEYEAAQRARYREIKARYYKPLPVIVPEPAPAPPSPPKVIAKVVTPLAKQAPVYRAGVRPPNPNPTVKFPAYGKSPHPVAIMRFVAKHYELSEDELRHTNRTNQFVRARHVGFWRSKNLTTHGLPSIARVFGKHDHTTALNGFRRIDHRRATDRALKAETDALMAIIRAAKVQA